MHKRCLPRRDKKRLQYANIFALPPQQRRKQQQSQGYGQHIKLLWRPEQSTHFMQPLNVYQTNRTGQSEIGIYLMSLPPLTFMIET